MDSKTVTVAKARRQLVLVALAPLVAFVLLGVWASTRASAGWEPGLVDALALGPNAWGDLVRAINTIGEPLTWAVMVIAIATVMWRFRGRAAAILVALTLASDLVAYVVKVVVARDRPDTAAAQFFGPDDYSFPSGHVVRAVSLAAVLVWLLAPPKWRLPGALLAGLGAWLVMGYARVSLGVHWPTDTLGGALLGIAWFALTAAWLAPLGVEPLPAETDTRLAA